VHVAFDVPRGCTLRADRADIGRPVGGEGGDPGWRDVMTPELTGYTSCFSVAPQESLSFMVSGDVERAEACLVRLIHGDERSEIGLVEREIPSALDGVWSLDQQTVHPGSFGVVEVDAARSPDAGADAERALSGHVFVWPSLVGRAAPQGLLAYLRADGTPVWEVVLEQGGDLVVRAADSAASASARLAGALRERSWHSVTFTLDRELGRVEAWSTALGGLGAEQTTHHAAAIADVGEPGRGSLLLAARRLIGRRGEPRATDTFNGRLERPALFAGRLDAGAAARLAAGVEPARSSAPVILELDLAACSEGWELWDRSSHARVGRVYNAPLRNCPSHAWRGETLTPGIAPHLFAAIHFHDDDVHHADWQPTREWAVPHDLESGVYALRLRSDEVEDRIPFIVRPPRDRAVHPVALWLPTFTYAAYANRRDVGGDPYGEFEPETCAGDEQLARHAEWGLSAYDLHADGSGAAMSSLARPIPNLRPSYRAGLVNAPRHLPADLYLVDWLERIGVPVDVFGDEDVHDQGLELLRRYATVVTGSHPEYVTHEELDAVEAYTNAGGRLMYLGGNGFYWVTTVAQQPGTLVEVRRGHAGTRSWDADPGVQHHQFTGEPGGLWRHRGRPPHGLVGVGFVAEGWDGENRPYVRTPESFTPQASWAFEGVGADEPIGEAGLVMGGAAGDEIDSADHALGTPPETIVLASSSGHSDAYWLVMEDVLFNAADLSGSKDSRIRADMTLTPKPNRGAVFAAGSISWSGALSHRDYDNPAARISANVLRTFASGASPWLPPVAEPTPGAAR
jgi:N,N-dimethylformamidase